MDISFSLNVYCKNFWHASSPFRRQPRTVVAKIQESICNISIDLDDHGSLVVQPCRRTASQQDTQFSDRTGAQTVISLNMKQWDVSRAFDNFLLLWILNLVMIKFYAIFYFT